MTPHTQFGRDLAWALSSPSMMRHPLAIDDDWGPHELASHPGLLARLDRPGSPLDKAVSAATSGRLGEYFEVVMRTWLEEVPPAKLIASNLQIPAKGGTLGEFDLLFRRDSVVWHWELAIKYYLGYREPAGAPMWYGPNPIDRLDIKWDKLLRRQLELSTKPAAREVLNRLGVDVRNIKPRAFIRGYLFDPLDPTFAAENHPDTSPDALRGWWCHRQALDAMRPAIEPDEALSWLVVPRLRWMSPVEVSDSDQLVRFEDLDSALPRHRPLMLAGLSMRSGELTERTRGFIVPPRWPP
jgi:uncharacterized protein